MSEGDCSYQCSLLGAAGFTYGGQSASQEYKQCYCTDNLSPSALVGNSNNYVANIVGTCAQHQRKLHPFWMIALLTYFSQLSTHIMNVRTFSTQSMVCVYLLKITLVNVLILPQLLVIDTQEPHSLGKNLIFFPFACILNFNIFSPIK